MEKQHLYAYEEMVRLLEKSFSSCSVRQSQSLLQKGISLIFQIKKKSKSQRKQRVNLKHLQQLK